MTDDISPSAQEILNHTLNDLIKVSNLLSKAAARLRVDPQPSGPPLTDTQRQAQAVTLGAISDATVTIDRAKDALVEALHTDERPMP
jgi:hypothetical protein